MRNLRATQLLYELSKSGRRAGRLLHGFSRLRSNLNCYQVLSGQPSHVVSAVLRAGCHALPHWLPGGVRRYQPMTDEKKGAGLRFECTECGECCRRRGTYAFVYLNDEEVDVLAGALELSRRSFLRRHTFLDEFGWRQLRFDDDHCRFLDTATNRCTVYHARPTQCRTFPFWREFTRRGAWTPEVRRICEGIGEGKVWDSDTVESAMAEKEAWDEE